jgi:peroxiredoxin Q/BCP
MVLKEGMKAPDFALNDKDSNVFKLYDLTSDYIVVYFYPKDNTPGCTIESKGFSSVLEEFKKLGVTVIGISGGDDNSKKKFCEKHDLNVILLSDLDFSVCKNYEAYGEKHFMGKKYNGISRITYILDKDKKIIKTYEKVKSAVHAEEVLNDIKSL